MLRSTLFILLLATASPAMALTLGPIETASALYEKFSARIEIEQGRGEDVRELQVSLANAADFERMRVERNFFLTELQFEVVRARGKTVIEITTRRPIVEPYLDFVIDVVWRQGRMLKEYTVLLDPPGLAQSAPAQSRPATQPAAPAVPTPSASAQTPTTNYGPTKRNDTMWSIAKRTRPDKSVSVEQHMMAIKRLNPTAFIKDNINLLKQGHVLRIPSAEETATLSRRAANRQVQDETDAWQKQKPVAAQRPETAPSGQLRIVSEEGDRAGGVRLPNITAPTPVSANATNSAGSATISRKMNTLEQGAEERLSSIKEQFEEQSQALAVKDQQLAELQAQVAEMQEEMNRLLALEGMDPDAVQKPPAANLLNQVGPLWLLSGGIVLLLALIWLLRRR